MARRQKSNTPNVTDIKHYDITPQEFRAIVERDTVVFGKRGVELEVDYCDEEDADVFGDILNAVRCAIPSLTKYAGTAWPRKHDLFDVDDLLMLIHGGAVKKGKRRWYTMYGCRPDGSGIGQRAIDELRKKLADYKPAKITLLPQQQRNATTPPKETWMGVWQTDKGPVMFANPQSIRPVSGAPQTPVIKQYISIVDILPMLQGKSVELFGYQIGITPVAFDDSFEYWALESLRWFVHQLYVIWEEADGHVKPIAEELLEAFRKLGAPAETPKPTDN